MKIEPIAWWGVIEQSWDELPKSSGIIIKPDIEAQPYRTIPLRQYVRLHTGTLVTNTPSYNTSEPCFQAFPLSSFWSLTDHWKWRGTANDHNVDDGKEPENRAKYE